MRKGADISKMPEKVNKYLLIRNCYIKIYVISKIYFAIKSFDNILETNDQSLECKYTQKLLMLLL